jgi:hypothetical protein
VKLPHVKLPHVKLPHVKLPHVKLPHVKLLHVKLQLLRLPLRGRWKRVLLRLWPAVKRDGPASSNAGRCSLER